MFSSLKSDIVLLLSYLSQARDISNAQSAYIELPKGNISIAERRISTIFLFYRYICLRKFDIAFASQSARYVQVLRPHSICRLRDEQVSHLARHVSIINIRHQKWKKVTRIIKLYNFICNMSIILFYARVLTNILFYDKIFFVIEGRSSLSPSARECAAGESASEEYAKVALLDSGRTAICLLDPDGEHRYMRK